MKKKKFKRKIRALLLLMFLTSLSLSTATYSWFSTNRIVYISDLNIKVQAQGGIEISTDAKEWNTILNQNDIFKANETYSNSTNQLPLTMEPVSTGKTVKNGKLEMYYGYTENIENDYILMANKSEEVEGSGEDSNGKFMAFDVFLKTTNDTNLYLSNESGATYEGENPGIENSVRFAFLVEGNLPETADYETIQNLNNATENTTYIWEPNYNRHSENAIKHAEEVYGMKISDGNSQILYDGIFANIRKDDKILVEDANASVHPNFFKRVKVDYLTSSEFPTNIEIFSLKAGITKVRVYIWIEGQDVDCEDSASLGDVSVNLQITTVQ